MSLPPLSIHPACRHRLAALYPIPGHARVRGHRHRELSQGQPMIVHTPVRTHLTEVGAPPSPLDNLLEYTTVTGAGLAVLERQVRDGRHALRRPLLHLGVPLIELGLAEESLRALPVR